MSIKKPKLGNGSPLCLPISATAVRTNSHRVLKVNTKDYVAFGKYKQDNILWADLIVLDPQYIQFCISEGYIELCNELYQIYKDYKDYL